MAQFGRAQDSQGTLTSPETMQRLIFGQYTNADESPVLSGGEVTGTAGMTYHVKAGSSVVKVGNGQAVLVVWDETDTGATTAPTGNGVSDVIYVDKDGLVGVARRGQVSESWYTTLDIRNVPAGITATTATTSQWDKNYALAPGTTNRVLAEWVDQTTTGTTMAKNWVYSMPVTVPRDMSICVELVSSAATIPRGGNDLGNASILFEVGIDNNYSSWRLEQYVNRVYATQQYLWYDTLKAGTHIVSVRRTSPYWAAGDVDRMIHVGIDQHHLPLMIRVREDGLAQ